MLLISKLGLGLPGPPSVLRAAKEEQGDAIGRVQLVARIARVGRAAAEAVEGRIVGLNYVRTRGIDPTVGGHIVRARTAVSKTVIEPSRNVGRGSNRHGTGGETVRVVWRGGVPIVNRGGSAANVIEDLLVAALVSFGLRIPDLAAELIEAHLEKWGCVLETRQRLADKLCS